MMWHRRLLAAGLAAGSMAAALTVLAPDPPPAVQVLAAAHDLSGGATLRTGDVHVIALPRESVPAGALTDRAGVVGRMLAGPVRRGEPLTDVRLLGREFLQAAAGGGEPLVATPVRIADAGIAMLVRPGDLVDVLAVDPNAGGGTTGGAGAGAANTGDVTGEAAVGGGGSHAADTRNAAWQATFVAAGVRVLSVPRPSGDGPFAPADPVLGDGALVVLATTSAVAARLARAAATSRLSVTLRSR